MTDGQPSKGRQGQSLGGAAPAANSSQILETLEGVFEEFRKRIQTQAPQPFDREVLAAVETYNTILAELNFTPTAITARPAIDTNTPATSVTVNVSPGQATA